MDIDFCFGYGFNKKTCKTAGIANAQDLNGFYIYNYDKAFVNVGSITFDKKTSEANIQKIVGQTAIHETLHRSIYKITKKYANVTEENFINKMVLWSVQ